MRVRFDTPEAFRELDGRAICPVCGLIQYVPKMSRFVTTQGENIFLCGKGRDCEGEGCGQRFIMPLETPERARDRADLLDDEKDKTNVS